MAGIYIHIPFCKQRCIYCDFFSTTQQPLQASYVKAICDELVLRKGYLDSESIETIYVGGGTPSLLTREELVLIFDVIAREYDLSNCKEITMEANPDDLTPAYIDILKQLPINRLSIGVQTFDDTLLNRLNRRHTSKQAIEAVQHCQRAGLDNLSIDLMYGLPDQDLDNWKSDLEQAISLQVPHISAYHLIYEEGTKLDRMRQAKQLKEVDEEESVSFFAHLIDRLQEVGYEQYEISNFAKNRCYSKHNTAYWQGVRYLGIGASAHSFDGKSRQWNVSNLDLYQEGIQKGVLACEIEQLDVITSYNEFIITSLRTKWGLSLDFLNTHFGSLLTSYCLKNALPYLESGKLVKESNCLKISREGIFLSDAIMADLLFVE